MKQIYIKPTVKVCQMKMSHNILQASQSVGVSSTNYSDGTILSREGGSSWDDED